MAGFGETLHQARAHLGVSLKEAEQVTRINRHHLAALEEENFAGLPPVIYQRGIVRNYAAFLKLDPGKVLTMFEDAHGTGGAPNHGSVSAMPPVDLPGHWAPNFAIIAFSLVLSAIVFAWVYSAFVAEPESDSTPAAALPTATPYESDIPWPTSPPVEKTPTAVPTEVATEPAADNAADPSTSTRRSGGDNQVEAAAGSGDNPPESTQAPEQASTTDTSGTRASDNQAESDAATTAVTEDQTGMTSISITASSEIYVTITADGEVVFDGTLTAGESTDQFAGSTFDVSTSSGVNTVFTNACGETFQMGYEEGEATYSGLAADENSCAPVQN